MPKIIRILRSCSMKIFSKFPTVNISKLNFWLVICIAKNFIWTTLKMIFSIFRFFCTLRFQIFKYCPIITNHTSMERLFIHLSDSKKLTLMTGFVLHGHIWSFHDSVLSILTPKYLYASTCLIMFLSLFFQEMDYNLLEEQLQKTLSDLEKREKALAHAETEVRPNPLNDLHRACRAIVFLRHWSGLDAEAAARDARRARVQPAGAAGRRQASARGLRSPGGAGEVKGQAARGSTGSAATAGKYSRRRAVTVISGSLKTRPWGHEVIPRWCQYSLIHSFLREEWRGLALIQWDHEVPVE